MVGLGLGVICVFFSCVIPLMALPATLPPKLAYGIFVSAEFILNFSFVVFITSYLRSDVARRSHMQVLLQKTLISFLPSLFMALVGGTIIYFKYGLLFAYDAFLLTFSRPPY